MLHAPSAFILQARLLDLQAMQHLQQMASLVDFTGQLVHVLQRERGITSLFLSSEGERFAEERDSAATASLVVERQFREALDAQLDSPSGAHAPMLSLMGWVLLELNSLQALRAAIAQRAPGAKDAVAGYSRVIAGLIELVFQVAALPTDPTCSRLLVALVHLIQIKEAAGQERALGAHLLASGLCADVEQQRLVHLIDVQEQGATTFLAFLDNDLQARWQAPHHSPNMAQLERLRRSLCIAKPEAKLDTSQSQLWFDVTSARILALGELETALVARLKTACEQGIAAAQQDLQDSTQLVERLKDNPPPHVQAVTRYFNDPGQADAVPLLLRHGQAARSEDTGDTQGAAVAAMQQLLEQQTSKLAKAEQELLKARQALQDRRVIERAKGVLMQRLGMSEDVAYRALQKAAMDHNKRLLDVAEATLALPDLVLASMPKNDSPAQS